jgi:hypothetical protein
MIADPATKGGDFAEIALVNLAVNSGNGVDAHRHFAMFCGSPGLYVTQIFTRDSNTPAAGVDMSSLTCKLASYNILNWIAQDGADPRNLRMPTPADNSSGGINHSPKEVTLLTSGSLIGQFGCKYDYAGDLGSLTTTGWCSTSGTLGL